MPRAAKSPSRSSKSEKPVAQSPSSVAELEEELAKAREELGLFKTPLRICRLFAGAASNFLAVNVLKFATSPLAITLLYPLLGIFIISLQVFPAWYAAPEDCKSGQGGGFLYGPWLKVEEALWWLLLGILSSIGLGTGLHSGLMFLWPFVMSIIIKAETAGSSSFSATYRDPCVRAFYGTADDSNTFLNIFFLLAPSIVLWGSGTAIGELPPYFITRAAKRAGKRASDFENELAEARAGTDLVSKLKVWTIDFTDKHGFVGILALASWPNAAFDMCGMACGWLEVPFWTFFGATLLGKGVIKVTLQTFVCILVFSQAFWEAFLALVPSVGLPTSVCAKAGMGEQDVCIMPNFFKAGRKKLMTSFALQERMVPKELMGDASYLDHSKLVHKYCSVEVAKEPLCERTSITGVWTGRKYEEFSDMSTRIVAPPPRGLDANGDGSLSLEELEPAVGFGGKLSLASLDPGTGSLFSVGNLWNAFIAGLICFFIYSIVEQVAIMAQAEYDSEQVAALEASLSAAPAKARTASSRRVASPAPSRAKSPATTTTKKAASAKKTPSSKRKKD